MEILQKITLYDILGYAVPGTCFLISLLWGAGMFPFGNEVNQSHVGYTFGVIVLFGYVSGMIIAELMAIILKNFVEKKVGKSVEDTIQRLGCEKIEKALKKAQIVEDSVSLDYEQIKEYWSYIYSDIQTDPRYVRIHNYASAELLCKNMAAVSVVFGAAFASQSSDLVEMLCCFGIGLVGAALFLSRWKKNYSKKHEYALFWFLQKHLSSLSPTT